MLSNIRSYEPDDFDAVDRLWKECFPGSPVRNHAEHAIPAKLWAGDNLFIVAQGEGGGIIGTVMAGYDGHRGWIYAVAVDSRCRRQGIGAALVRAAEERLIALGCMKINLQIHSDNAAVARFYYRIGYALEQRISMGKQIHR